jgi:hypothetical protein
MTSTQVLDPANAPVHAPVTVTVLGGENIPLDYEPELTLGEYLRRADVRVRRDQVVTVNGVAAGSDDIVEPNSVVVVVGKVANG